MSEAVPNPYHHVKVEQEARRRFRLVPVALNGRRLPHAKTYVSERNARRAARRLYPGCEVRYVDRQPELERRRTMGR